MNKNSNNLYKNNKSSNVLNSLKMNNTKSSSSSSASLLTSSATYTSSNMAGIIILVVIIIAIAGSAYWIYNYYTTHNFQKPVIAELMPDVKDASKSTVISSNSVPSSSYSNEYSISCWVNIQDYTYNYGNEKVILRRGKAGSGNPEIILDSKKNDLIVRIKLQGGGNSVSKFEDIPIKLKSQNIGLGFIQPEEAISSKSDTSDIPDSLNKIGSNSIDYPTIQYTFDNNTSQCGYFDMISGNTLDKGNTKGNNNGNRLVEGFSNIDDAVNASIKVVVDICNIATTLQNQQTADTSVDSLNSFYQNIIDTLEKNRTTGKISDDINQVIASAMSSNTSSPTQSNSLGGSISTQLKTLEDDLNALQAFNNVTVDYNTLFTAVNNKMALIKCPLTFDGTNEIDGTIGFYQNLIKLLKKSKYTYINNMGSGIRKTYPDLNSSSDQVASCLVDSNTSNKDPTIGTCIVKMIPLQKWVNVVISVYNQILDIYIDGNLSSSCVLKGFPAISTEDVNITPDGGFAGKIARVSFMNTAMTVGQAKKLYYSGPIVTESIFSMVPYWIYWVILIIVIIAIGYSFFM